MVVERVFSEDDSILLDSLLTSFVKDQIDMEVEKFINHLSNEDNREVA